MYYKYITIGFYVSFGLFEEKKLALNAFSLIHVSFFFQVLN